MFHYYHGRKKTELEKLGIIKTLLSLDNQKQRNSLLSYYSIFGMDNSEIIKLDVQYNFINHYKTNCQKNRLIFSEENELYNQLLNSMVKLSQELHLTNSLELSNLFIFLLWNGYLSKNKELVFDFKRINNINGVSYLDIANGYTVCLNNSIFLKDFLNNTNNKSLVLESRYDNKI